MGDTGIYRAGQQLIMTWLIICNGISMENSNFFQEVLECNFGRKPWCQPMVHGWRSSSQFGAPNSFQQLGISNLVVSHNRGPPNHPILVIYRNKPTIFRDPYFEKRPFHRKGKSVTITTIMGICRLGEFPFKTGAQEPKRGFLGICLLVVDEFDE